MLGLAEAGFFPGIILYLSYWFPARHRAFVTAMFMTAANRMELKPFAQIATRIGGACTVMAALAVFAYPV